MTQTLSQRYLQRFGPVGATGDANREAIRVSAGSRD